MEVEADMQREVNNVMCQLADPEGTPLGPPMYLPQNAGPQQLQQIVNKLLNNVRIQCLYSKLHAFCWILLKIIAKQDMPGV